MTTSKILDYELKNVSYSQDNVNYSEFLVNQRAIKNIALSQNKNIPQRRAYYQDDTSAPNQLFPAQKLSLEDISISY